MRESAQAAISLRGPAGWGHAYQGGRMRHRQPSSSLKVTQALGLKHMVPSSQHSLTTSPPPARSHLGEGPRRLGSSLRGANAIHQPAGPPNCAFIIFTLMVSLHRRPLDVWLKHLCVRPTFRWNLQRQNFTIKGINQKPQSCDSAGNTGF